jgi:hypothetical protein
MGFLLMEAARRTIGLCTLRKIVEIAWCLVAAITVWIRRRHGKGCQKSKWKFSTTKIHMKIFYCKTLIRLGCGCDLWD